MGVFLFPGVKGLFDDAQLPTQITERRAGFGLEEGIDDLLFREVRTDSSINSFRREPSKLPFYSRFTLPSFSEETSVSDCHCISEDTVLY
jgi:hypothetical protein